MATLSELPAQSFEKKNRIQVSNTKRPLFFYVNLAKRYIQQHDEVELSALGMAITTVVTIAEILKNNGVATSIKVSTSTVGMKDENKGRMIPKAKIEIVLGKSEKFDSQVVADVATVEQDSAKTVEPVGATTVKPDVAATAKPDGADTIEPDAAATVEPDAAATVEPEASTTVEPVAATTVEQDTSKDEK